MIPLLLDLRLDNARIHTMDPERPIASRLGVLHGRIVGFDADIADIGARQVVDARGRTVVPGFVDAHNHLAWTGQAAVALDLSGAADIGEVLGRIGRRAEQTPPAAWVDVVGYDQRPLGRHLTRHDLDPVSAGRRVQLIHTSGHAHLVNSLALAGVDPAALSTGGSNVVRDDAGEPTGLFLEDATTLVNALRTPYPLSELMTAIETAARRCVAEGVTFAAEAGIGGGLVARSPVELAAYQRALEAGRLPLRAQIMVSLDAFGPVAAHPGDGITDALALGQRTGFGGGRLMIGAAKAWLDGGMMARTAALTAPYCESDRDGDGARGGDRHRSASGSGELSRDLDQLGARAVAAHRAGWQLALHAIGDRAIDAALDIIEAAQAARPRPDARHRIEHAGLVRPDQLPRLAAAGVVAVTQPTFLHAFGDDYADIMGPERAPWLYRGRSYLDAGIAVAGSSDRPVADGAPLRGVQFLVERRTRTGQVVGADEAMTVDQAMRAYTVGGAYACRVEDQVGRLAPGMRADLVVLGADPWSVAPSELAAIPVLTTVVGGVPVHGNWPG